MSGVFKVIGTIAAVVAVVAGAVVTFGASLGLSAWAIGAASMIATVAGVVSAVAMFAAQQLAKPPPARGSVTSLLISPDAPSAYVMGEGVFAGALRHDVGYGATLDDVPNPYRFMAIEYCVAGPVDSITPWVDLAPVSSWYSGFMWTDVKLGARPEASALAPHFAGAPGWGSTYKLSSKAAIGWSMLFDKDGKRFASGTPKLGAYGKWVKVYDPRLDSTFPGGSGSHRINDETTWTWSENPALHAGAYAYGRYVSGKLVMGVGLPVDGIDFITLAHWANVCDANGWRLFGVVTEPGDRWANLKDICAAGGADPVFAGGQLSFRYSAPKVTLDTITEADLVDDAFSVTAMASWRDRINTIIPKYRSPDHDWELVDADPVSVSTYVTEDGEEKPLEWPFNFVKDVDQASQLAAYKILDSRELQPIKLPCNPRLRAYRPGECVHVDIPQLGLDTPAIILKRELDPSGMKVILTLMGETPTKHDYALGVTGTPPATPALGLTPQARDEAAAGARLPAGWVSSMVRGAAVKNPRNTSNVPGPLLKATESGGSVTVTVARHDWDYPVGTADITREQATITGLLPGTTYWVYFDDWTLADAAPTYHATTSKSSALNGSAHAARHGLGAVATPVSGSGLTSTGGNNVGFGFDL